MLIFNDFITLPYIPPVKGGTKKGIAGQPVKGYDAEVQALSMLKNDRQARPHLFPLLRGEEASNEGWIRTLCFCLYLCDYDKPGTHYTATLFGNDLGVVTFFLPHHLLQPPGACVGPQKNVGHIIQKPEQTAGC